MVEPSSENTVPPFVHPTQGEWDAIVDAVPLWEKLAGALINYGARVRADAVKQERERCARQLQGMAESIRRICQEPGVSLAVKELGKVRIEALTDAAFGIRGVD